MKKLALLCLVAAHICAAHAETVKTATQPWTLKRIAEATNAVAAAIPPPAPVQSVNGKTGAVALTAADVGAVSNFGPNTISGGFVDGVGYVLSRLALKNDGMGAPIDISPGSFGDGAQITLGGYAYGGRLIVEKGSSTGDPSFGAKIEVRGALASITKNGREVATEEAVTNIVKNLSLGGIWDGELEVWWTPRMENGSLTYYATTNVNLTAEGSR